ncbi:calcium-binding protein [Trichothermofontia sp.]
MANLTNSPCDTSINDPRQEVVPIEDSPPDALGSGGAVGRNRNTLPITRQEGTANADNLTGTSESDLIYGRFGNDTLTGLGSNDTLYGGKSDDLLKGGDGDDQLYGDRDNDTLFGEGGNDLLRGGKNDDSLIGGTGSDRLYGDLGNDTLIGVDPDADAPGRGEIDTLLGGEGADYFPMGANGKVFYNGDGNTDTGFVWIQDFDVEADVLQLPADQRGNFRLAAPPPGFAGNGLYLGDELIAIIVRDCGCPSFSLDANYVEFV